MLNTHTVKLTHSEKGVFEKPDTLYFENILLDIIRSECQAFLTRFTLAILVYFLSQPKSL